MVEPKEVVTIELSIELPRRAAYAAAGAVFQRRSVNSTAELRAAWHEAVDQAVDAATRALLDKPAMAERASSPSMKRAYLGGRHPALLGCTAIGRLWTAAKSMPGLTSAPGSIPYCARLQRGSRPMTTLVSMGR